MKTALDKGATLAEMAKGWFQGRRSGGVKTPPDSPTADPAAGFFNPMKLSIGGYVGIDTTNYFKKTFSVEKIGEFTRQIGTRSLLFADYVLKSEDEGKETWVTVRAIPEDGRRGPVSCYLFVPHQEMGYDQKTEKVFNGQKVVDNDLRKTFLACGKPHWSEASVREASTEGVESLRIKYWDFIHEEKKGPNLHLLVEMDLTNKKGWIQTFLGTPCATEDIRPIAGHRKTF